MNFEYGTFYGIFLNEKCLSESHFSSTGTNSPGSGLLSFCAVSIYRLCLLRDMVSEFHAYTGTIFFRVSLSPEPDNSQFLVLPCGSGH